MKNESRCQQARNEELEAELKSKSQDYAALLDDVNYRISELQAELARRDARLNWLLSKIFVGQHGVSMPCGPTKITDDMRRESVARIDKQLDQLQPAPQEEATTLGCYDCGLEYGGDNWVEAVIPHKVWRRISPKADSGGILCISCIAGRLAKLGLDRVRVPVACCGTEPLDMLSRDLEDERVKAILNTWDVPAPQEDTQ